MEIRDPLQRTPGGTYTLERELSGGSIVPVLTAGETKSLSSRLARQGSMVDPKRRVRRLSGIERTPR